MKTSVLIPDGESTLTKFVIQCLALDNNVDIHILSKDPNAAVKHSRHIKSFHLYNTNKIGVVQPRDSEYSTKEIDELVRFHHYDATRSQALLEEIMYYSKVTGANILFPIDEHIVKILSANKTKLSEAGLRFLMADHDMFTTAIDKWKLSQFLKAHQVPHPDTAHYKEGVTEETIGQLNFPVIIKPIDQGNAMGIQSFDSSAAMWSFFKSQKLKHSYVIQPLIDGYDIDCSVLCANGKVISYTIQKGIVSPKVKYRAAVGIEFLQNTEVIQVVEQMMALLNWSGVAHIDLRYDTREKKIKVIEINARYWGSLLGSLNAGVNFPALAYKTTLGDTVGIIKFKFNRYFMGKSPIKKIAGTLFASGNERIRLRDTSLYYTLKDPKPVLFEMLAKIKNRI